jgi:hypothetical protein
MEDTKNIAAMLNPALEPFAALAGKWKTTGTHPYIPDTILQGQASFDWIEGGAFLMMHAKIDHQLIPVSTAIFGTDNATGECFILYFDSRGVSRKMDVTFKDNVLKWWRNGPEFSQRYSFTFSDDGNTIISKGEMSKDGTNWERDLDLEYTRVM